MKHFILIFSLLFSGIAFAQTDVDPISKIFKSYEKAVIELRNGEILNGEAKITNDNRIRFRNDSGKETYNYRTAKTLEITTNERSTKFTYKIIGGKEPILFEILYEADKINLYSKSKWHQASGGAVLGTNGQFIPGGFGQNYSYEVYYINKSGHEIYSVGTTGHPKSPGKFVWTEDAENNFLKTCPATHQLIQEMEAAGEIKIEEVVRVYSGNCE